MLSYGLFPKTYYMRIVDEVFGLIHSQSMIHTAVRHLLLTASTTGILRLTEAFREPVQFPPKLLSKVFSRLEKTGVTSKDALWHELHHIRWVAPEPREVKVECQRLKDTQLVCDELKSQASLWKLQFNDLKDMNDKNPMGSGTHH